MAKEQYQNAIDWVWNNSDPPQQAKCLFYVVNFNPSDVVSDPKQVKFRENRTGNECAVEAIKAARAGNRDQALRWLMAGQCQNDDHRKDIENAGPQAVEYLLSEYGAKVPEN